MGKRVFKVTSIFMGVRPLRVWPCRTVLCAGNQRVRPRRKVTLCNACHAWISKTLTLRRRDSGKHCEPSTSLTSLSTSTGESRDPSQTDFNSYAPGSLDLQAAPACCFHQPLISPTLAFSLHVVTCLPNLRRASIRRYAIPFFPPYCTALFKSACVR